MSAGVNQTRIRSFFVPPGQAQVSYAPNDLAWKVENFEVDPVEGTLVSVTGPCEFEPIRSGSTPIVRLLAAHSVHYASLAGGSARNLYYRAGATIYRHHGPTRGYESIASGFSRDSQRAFPDVWVTFNGMVIFSDGVNPAYVILHDDTAFPLGFTDLPGVPTTRHPSPVPTQDRETLDQSQRGYSWQGGIGTVGDVLSLAEGKVLAGSWVYRTVMVDLIGNRSAPSAEAYAECFTAKANPFRFETDGSTNGLGTGTELDDLTRQFALMIPGGAPSHAVAIEVYRTPDLRQVGGVGVEPRLLRRVDGGRAVQVSDSTHDAFLGRPLVPNVPVPVFRVACVHGGRLVVGNLLGAPNLVRRSETGFPGSFFEDEWTAPDAGGGEVTGLASFANRLYAFTATTVYDITRFDEPPQVVSRATGCVAPASIAVMPSGQLVWLGGNDFYAMSPGGEVRSVGGGVRRTLRWGVARGRLSRAVSAIDPRTGEYRCALSEAGTPDAEQRLVFCWDGQNWREQRLGLHIAGMTAYGQEGLVVAGKGDLNGIFVLDREYAEDEPSARVSRYTSGWLRGDKLGLIPVNVRTIWVALRDTGTGTATLKLYQNGSWTPVPVDEDGGTEQQVKLMGLDYEDSADAPSADVLGSGLVGTMLAHEPRVFWRKLSVNLRTVTSWAFSLEATYPARLDIWAFAFDTGVHTDGDPFQIHPEGMD